METPDKDTLKEIQDRLTLTPRLVWDHLDEGERSAMETYAQRYKSFLDEAKTEREAVLRGTAPGSGAWVYRPQKRPAGIKIFF